MKMRFVFLYYLLLFLIINNSTNIIINMSYINDKNSNHKIIIYYTKIKRMTGGSTIYI